MEGKIIFNKLNPKRTDRCEKCGKIFNITDEVFVVEDIINNGKTAIKVEKVYCNQMCAMEAII